VTKNDGLSLTLRVTNEDKHERMGAFDAQHSMINGWGVIIHVCPTIVTT
jgi:hypothetical protein